MGAMHVFWCLISIIRVIRRGMGWTVYESRMGKLRKWAQVCVECVKGRMKLYGERLFGKLLQKCSENGRIVASMTSSRGVLTEPPVAEY